MTPTLEQLDRLARDCEIVAYRSSGPGGQKKNKTASSIRVRHLPSGIVRIATEHRSQTRNRRLALERIWRELARRARPRKKRLATRPTVAAVERRLDIKRRAAQKKRERGAVDE
jgi:peptide chain release factor 1